MAKVLLEKEVKAAQEDPNLGVSCGQDEEDALKVKVIIYGHLGTTYEGGMFRVTIYFSENYPCTPPEVKFDSKIFHPNINKEGNIDLDILSKDNWLPTYSLTSILTSIRSLLVEPCPTWPHPANPEATDLFLVDRSQYYTKVKDLVKQTFCDEMLATNVEEKTPKEAISPNIGEVHKANDEGANDDGMEKETAKTTSPHIGVAGEVEESGAKKKRRECVLL